eukprot:gene5383-5618_t
MKLRSLRTPEAGAFLVMDQAKAAARASGKTIVDLSASLADPAAHKYCLKSGTMPLLHAAVDWYEQTYGVSLDPHTQALSLIGSQEGLAHLLLAVTDPGDGILMTDVAYPSYFGAVRIAGAVADVRFWQQTLDFCKQHDLLLIHDNPYVGQVYDAAAAPSPLSLPGAAKRCVELFSFAKSYQLGGFRLGFALGNAEALAALEAVKAPIDFNQYIGIQRMGVACLKLPVQRVRDYAKVWQQRAAALAPVLQAHGWQLPTPRACMYVWCKLPAGLAACGIDDLQFCRRLVSETGIAISPGRGFGPGGVNYVRFALVQPEAVLLETARAVARFAEQLLQLPPGKAEATPAGSSPAAPSCQPCEA